MRSSDYRRVSGVPPRPRVSGGVELEGVEPEEKDGDGTPEAARRDSGEEGRSRDTLIILFKKRSFIL
jgi:hypothetical protein